MYDRELSGRTLSFGVSGRLYRNSLIMYDRETGSPWSHFLGAAVQGPLKGARLGFVPSTLTDWGAWRREHPRTLVLDTGEGGSDSYEGYYAGGATGILGTRRRDCRFAPKEGVLGVLRAAMTARAFLATKEGVRPLPATPVFWFAWVDFFPGAPLWEPKR